MRLANVSGRAVFVTADERGVDVHAASDGRFGPSLESVYESWELFEKWVTDAELGGGTEFAPEDLGPPSPAPRQIFAVGLNFKGHAAEAEIPLPEAPSIFTKFQSCLSGPFSGVPLVPGHCDWEVEMVVVIGRMGREVPQGQGWDHVAGVTVGQDISERIAQTRGAMPQFSVAKSHPGFGPTGPYLVTVDELLDRDDLEVGCSINGDQVQVARTSDMVFDVDELIHRLSATVTLMPGDLVFTGTPGGVGIFSDPVRALVPGDVIETWVEGVGRMRNVCS